MGMPVIPVSFFTRFNIHQIKLISSLAQLKSVSSKSLTHQLLTLVAITIDRQTHLYTFTFKLKALILIKDITPNSVSVILVAKFKISKRS